MPTPRIIQTIIPNAVAPDRSFFAIAVHFAPDEVPDLKSLAPRLSVDVRKAVQYPDELDAQPQRLLAVIWNGDLELLEPEAIASARLPPDLPLRYFNEVAFQPSIVTEASPPVRRAFAQVLLGATAIFLTASGLDMGGTVGGPLKDALIFATGEATVFVIGVVGPSLGALTTRITQWAFGRPLPKPTENVPGGGIVGRLFPQSSQGVDVVQIDPASDPVDAKSPVNRAGDPTEHYNRQPLEAIKSEDQNERKRAVEDFERAGPAAAKDGERLIELHQATTSAAVRNDIVNALEAIKSHLTANPEIHRKATQLIEERRKQQQREALLPQQRGRQPRSKG